MVGLLSRLHVHCHIWICVWVNQTRIWHWLNDSWHSYVSQFVDVGISIGVCFDLVNQNPVGRLLSTGGLHDVTVNQLDSDWLQKETYLMCGLLRGIVPVSVYRKLFFTVSGTLGMCMPMSLWDEHVHVIWQCAVMKRTTTVSSGTLTSTRNVGQCPTWWSPCRT